MKQGEISGPIQGGGNGIVLSIVDTQEPTPDSYAAKQDEIRDSLRTNKQDELFTVFVSNLRDQMQKSGKIRINQDRDEKTRWPRNAGRGGIRHSPWPVPPAHSRLRCPSRHWHSSPPHFLTFAWGDRGNFGPVRISSLISCCCASGVMAGITARPSGEWSFTIFFDIGFCRQSIADQFGAACRAWLA